MYTYTAICTLRHALLPTTAIFFSFDGFFFRPLQRVVRRWAPGAFVSSRKNRAERFRCCSLRVLRAAAIIYLILFQQLNILLDRTMSCGYPTVYACVLSPEMFSLGQDKFETSC